MGECDARHGHAAVIQRRRLCWVISAMLRHTCTDVDVTAGKVCVAWKVESGGVSGRVGDGTCSGGHEIDGAVLSDMVWYLRIVAGRCPWLWSLQTATPAVHVTSQHHTNKHTTAGLGVRLSSRSGRNACCVSCGTSAVICDE